MLFTTVVRFQYLFFPRTFALDKSRAKSGGASAIGASSIAAGLH